MLAGDKADFDCIKTFSEAAFSEDLEKFDVPTLVPHSGDRIVPIGPSTFL